MSCATFPAVSDGYLFLPPLAALPGVTFSRAYQLAACVTSISDWLNQIMLAGLGDLSCAEIIGAETKTSKTITADLPTPKRKFAG